ncbi:MAG TPA: hypothetical protein VEO56_10800 [Bacteroidota bacterium]|nr:hypothetical protein [Bacteroidota bacterium]
MDTRRVIVHRGHVAPLAGAFIAAGLVWAGCINPFAPGRDDGTAVSACDPHTIDGLFQCFQSAYSFRDTTVYGPLVDAQFVFSYRDYDLGVDETWGRDEEMRTTYGLFQNAQRLDLIWNAVVSTSAESTSVNVVRGFTLTVVFNPSDIEEVDGYANLTLQRQRATDPWRIVYWRDESNF